jgi:hypothetical protein
MSSSNPLNYLGPNPTANPAQVISTRAPTSSDKRPLGTIWVDEPADKAYITPDPGVWEEITYQGGGGGGALNDLDGDTGTATPASGTIIIAGGTNVSTSGSGDTITIDVPTATAVIQGVAAFDSADFTVTAGDVTLATDILPQVDADTGSAVPASGVLDIVTVAGQGIETSGAGSVLTITGVDASTSVKGVAQFESSRFTASSGLIDIKDSVARVYYVASNGHDTNNDGSIYAPFLTIGKAVTQAVSDGVNPGNRGVIYIGPDVFNEVVTLEAGIYLCGMNDGAQNNACIINGGVSYAGSGNAGVSGLYIVSNGSDAISVTGNGSALYLNGVTIQCSNSGERGIYLNAVNGYLEGFNVNVNAYGSSDLPAVDIVEGSLNFTKYQISQTASGIHAIANSSSNSYQSFFTIGNVDGTILSTMGGIFVFGFTTFGASGIAITQNGSGLMGVSNCLFTGSDGSGYVADGSGTFAYANLTFFGSASNLSPTLNGGAGGDAAVLKNRNLGAIYDNSVSGLGATTVQAAIDELAQEDGVTWNIDNTGTISASVNNGYICNAAGQTVITLPSTAGVGALIEVVGNGVGGWKIAQNAGQSIRLGVYSSTVGALGYLASTDQYDSVKLLCTVADTEFRVLYQVGNTSLT